MVLHTKHAPSPNNLIILWRSRLVWSRARDWKSRNRQKRFKSSNLFFSAKEKPRKCEVFILRKERLHDIKCRGNKCCRTLRLTLRVVCKHTARYYAKRTACYESLLLRQSSPAIRRIVFYLCQHLHLCKNVGINKKRNLLANWTAFWQETCGAKRCSLLCND